MSKCYRTDLKTLRIGYYVAEPNLRFRCVIGLNTQGVCAFTSVESTEALRTSVGYYSSAVMIPSHMLAESEYSVTVSVFDSKGTRRQLILVPREAPYSSIHLEHMLKLSNMGVTILPASPGFYHQPQTIDDLVDFVVARILNLLNIPQDMLPRWGEHHLSSDE